MVPTVHPFQGRKERSLQRGSVSYQVFNWGGHIETTPTRSRQTSASRCVGDDDAVSNVSRRARR